MANDPWGVSASKAPAKGDDPWGVSASASPAAADNTPALGGAPGFGSGGFGAVEKTVNRAGKNATKTVGRAIVQGHKDPVGSLLKGLEATQRLTHAAELDTLGGQNINPVEAVMNPKLGPGMKRQVDTAMGMNKGGVFDQLFAGTGIPQKLIRAGGHTAVDVGNDVGSFVPVGKVGSVLKDVIPGVKPAAEFIGKKVAESPLGALLNPDHNLRGLTDEAKADHNVIVNKAKEAAKAQHIADDAVIKKHAAAIRSGEMPSEVARLFQPKPGAVLPKQVRPGASTRDLNRAVPTMEAPINEIEPKFTDTINQRPSGVSRGASVTPNEPPRKPYSPAPGDVLNARPSGVARGARVTPKDVPRPELAPTIRPGAPREALNARPVVDVAPRAKIKGKFTDTMSRSNPGQSTGDAWKSHFIDDETGALKFGPGTRPQDVAQKLSASRAPALQDEIEKGLRGAGFLDTPESIRASQSMGKPGLFSAPVEQIPSVQARLLKNLAPKPERDNAILKGAKALTHRGNQAFLANPVPHVGNLANLAYNKYGAPTTLKGLLLNAPRVAMGKTGGHLGENINELESLGAKSQYGNIFDEMGLTRLVGIPGTEGAARALNVPLVALQRASNAAQHKILNSAETGLRSAALDAERAGGTHGAQAAKNIHATFGTDSPNALTSGAQDLAAPFFKFHGQTAPGSVLNTLARNPARITNALKANQDYNAQVNPHGPKYHSTVPGANAGRMLMDPLGYFGSLGPISELQSPYGLLAELKKGPKGVAKVIGDSAAKFTPGSQEISALAELLKHKKGHSKQSGVQDLSSTLFGGYYGK